MDISVFVFFELFVFLLVLVSDIGVWSSPSKIIVVSSYYLYPHHSVHSWQDFFIGVISYPGNY